MNYSLPNTTISPYKSLFRGGLISYSPKTEPEIILTAGYGKYTAADDTERLGEGNLFDLAFGYEFSRNFVAQANFIFGGMDSIDRPDKFFSSDGEFFTQFTINYLFYSRKNQQSD